MRPSTTSTVGRPPAAPTAAPTAPVAAPPGGGVLTDKLLQGLNNAEAKNLAAISFSAQEQHLDRVAQKRTTRNWTIAAILTVLGVIGFFASNIMMQRYKFPALFKVYDRMKHDKYGGRCASGCLGAPFYGMAQICTAMQFYPTQAMLEGWGVWKVLSRTGATFLANCASALPALSRGDPLTSLHWNGSPEQNKASKLLGKDGWAYTGCGTSSMSLVDRQNTLCDAWYKGRQIDPKTGLKDNIWYDYFPDPKTEREAFLKHCCIEQLFEGSVCGDTKLAAADNCDPSGFPNISQLYLLYAGGLCRVAYSVSQESATTPGELWAMYFASPVEVKPSCSGAYTAGATEGAMAGLGAMMPLAAMTGGIGFAVAALAVTAASATAGALTQGAAAKEKCENS